MKTYAVFLLTSLILLVSPATFAVNRAVNINLGSIGGPLDHAAVRVVRQVVGNAVVNGTVDKFEVANLPLGAPFPIEGGFTACAEAGYKVAAARFNAFIQDLKSIKPKSGTFYNVIPVESCSSAVAPPLCESCDPIEPPTPATVCTQDAMICPDGSAVGRVAPSCEFAPCPAPK